ncbi:MAG: hypothetical protein GXY42_11655 [Desulfovibrionales bacterium]|nr:hypothetical protein [Desulfovibrionales bacterium]
MWVQIALFVASLVISYLTRPKTNYDKPKPGTVETGAVAQAGGEIPVLFGTRDITGQNIVWYGDIKTKAIKKSGGKK